LLAGCTAISQSDAVALTGDPSIQNVSNGQAAGVEVCVYNDLRSSAAGAAVVIDVTPMSGTITAQTLQTALAQHTTNSPEPVSGIGAAAYVATAAHEADIVFNVGTTVVVATVTSNANPGSVLLTRLEAVARRIAGMLS
jgi:hypothetical protein